MEAVVRRGVGGIPRLVTAAGAARQGGEATLLLAIRSPEAAGVVNALLVGVLAVVV